LYTAPKSDNPVGAAPIAAQPAKACFGVTAQGKPFQGTHYMCGKGSVPCIDLRPE
jgi:hypothetical protein